jgi:hypothetical protein
MIKQKYIITKDGVIIVFSELLQHSDFKKFEPISAGFISFGIRSMDGEMTCNCYGESISLGLKSNPDEDVKIARRQLGFEY